MHSQLRLCVHERSPSRPLSCSGTLAHSSTTAPWWQCRVGRGTRGPALCLGVLSLLTRLCVVAPLAVHSCYWVVGAFVCLLCSFPFLSAQGGALLVSVLFTTDYLLLTTHFCLGCHGCSRYLLCTIYYLVRSSVWVDCHRCCLLYTYCLLLTTYYLLLITLFSWS